jgi:hypothetical protein
MDGRSNFVLDKGDKKAYIKAKHFWGKQLQT